MTPGEITKLRELCNGATPGPWHPHEHTLEKFSEGLNLFDEHYCRGKTASLNYCWIERDGGCCITAMTGNGPTSFENAAFIAAAREAVPKLLDALEAAERERDEAGSAYVMASGLLATEQVRSADALKERDTARAQVETLARALRWYEWASNGARYDCDFGGYARDTLAAAGLSCWPADMEYPPTEGWDKERTET